MGKKRVRGNARDSDSDGNADDDDELQAELAAIRMMRAEAGLEENGTEEHDHKYEGEASIISSSRPRKQQRNVYNKEGLLHSLEGVGTVHLPFIETLSLCQFSLTVHDENDDLDREVSTTLVYRALENRVTLSSSSLNPNNPFVSQLTSGLLCFGPFYVWSLQLAFYNHALLAANVGRTTLEQLGVPTRRPNDYFCENVKSDAHMIRVSVVSDGGLAC